MPSIKSRRYEFMQPSLLAPYRARDCHEQNDRTRTALHPVTSPTRGPSSPLPAHEGAHDVAIIVITRYRQQCRVCSPLAPRETASTRARFGDSHQIALDLGGIIINLEISEFRIDFLSRRVFRGLFWVLDVSICARRTSVSARG